MTQNSVKVPEVRHTADTKEAREEQTRIIENKLFIAERNRALEMERRLENIRKHVGWGIISLLANSRRKSPHDSFHLHDRSAPLSTDSIMRLLN